MAGTNAAFRKIRVKRWLVIAVIVFTLVLAATGWVYAKVFIVESFPVEVHVTAVVEGLPVDFTERAQCYQHHMTHSWCPWCTEWVVNYGVVRHILPSGAVFQLGNGMACRYLAENPPPTSEQQWTEWWRGCTVSAFWYDDVRFPLISEEYRQWDNAASDILAKNPHVQLGTIRQEIRRGPSEPFYVGFSLKNKSQEPAYWGRQPVPYGPSPYGPEVDLWILGDARVITRSVWQASFELPADIAAATIPVRIAGDEARAVLNGMRVRRGRNSGCWDSNGLSFEVFDAPLAPDVNGVWRVDLDRAGIQLLFRDGEPGPGGRLVTLPVGDKAGPIVTAGYDGNYAYDPATENIYYVGRVFRWAQGK